MRAIPATVQKGDSTGMLGDFQLYGDISGAEKGYMKVYMPGALLLTETDKNKEVITPREAQPAPEAVQRGGVIDGTGNQARWERAQLVHKLEQGESATSLYRDKTPATEKFQLFDSKQDAHAPEAGALSGRVQETHVIPLANTPDGWLAAGQKIATLPMEMQVKIVGIGLAVGIEQHHHDEQERQLGAAIGSIKGAGNVLTNLAKIADFSACCILGNQEKVGGMVHEFGTAVAETTVSGLNLIGAAQKYSYDIGYTGDYGKPARDVVAVGNMLDQKWSKLTPREQEVRKYELITQLTADGLLGAGLGATGAQAIAKAKSFSQVLGVVAKEAAKTTGRTISGSKQAVRDIAEAVDNLMPAMGDTGNGLKMPIPKTRPSENVCFSKADDLHGANKPGDIQTGKPGKPSEIMDRPPSFNNGQPLQFDLGAGVDVRTVKVENPTAWDDLGRSPRGKEFHLEMGENLPTNHKGVDRWDPTTRTATSFKTRDLRTDSYKTYKQLYERLEDDLNILKAWDGKIVAGKLRIRPRDILDRRLDIGIPDGVMTLEQKRAIEDISRLAVQKKLLFRVTVIK